MRSEQSHDEDVDERTGIMSHSSSQNYQAVNASSHDGTVRRRTTAQGSADTNEQRRAEQKTQWWKGTFDKFRSIELENKGSVARDHLALGMVYAVYVLNDWLTCCRTNFSGLATYVFGLCIDWYCGHTAISIEQDTR